MRKYIPRIGTVFGSLEDLVDKLEASGWEWEGQGTSLLRGKVAGYDVGVVDRKRNLWVIVHLKPYRGKVKVVKIERIKDWEEKSLKSLYPRKEVIRRGDICG